MLDFRQVCISDKFVHTILYFRKVYAYIQSTSKCRTIDRSVIYRSVFGRSNDSNFRIGILCYKCPKSERSNAHVRISDTNLCLKSEFFGRISALLGRSSYIWTERWPPDPNPNMFRFRTFTVHTYFRHFLLLFMFWAIHKLCRLYIDPISGEVIQYPKASKNLDFRVFKLQVSSEIQIILWGFIRVRILDRWL